MAELLVPWVKEADGLFSLEEIGSILTNYREPHLVNELNWAGYTYKPVTKFWMGCGPSEIVLHFEVEEDSVRTEFGKTGDPVYRDSCVEFFINPGDDTYFNFETNAVGTRYAARGHDREDSTPFFLNQIETIRRTASLGHSPFGERPGRSSWTLTLGIPLRFFTGTELSHPFGKSFKGNFYKCGDDTLTPHYVSWNPIGTAQPDFHRPDYFGKITFAPMA